MKEYNQWLISNPGNKIPCEINGKKFRWNTGKTYSYQEAREEAERRNWNYGFYLLPDDPFTCIDLDWHDGDSIEKAKLLVSISNQLETYQEISKGGKGLHIWMKGNIGKGIRQNGMEIYSQYRYMICTGKVYKDLPIADYQHWLNQFIDTLPRGLKVEDHEIISKALASENREKVRLLLDGKWQELGYPSHSEADAALLYIFWFWSGDREQVKRIFLSSELGKREKATKGNYVDRTINAVITKWKYETTPVEINLEIAKPEKIEKIDWPPGLTGLLAKWIYDCSIRPVKEFSIIAALAFFSGIFGKCWNINGVGLNNYYLIIGKSGLGKEGIFRGINGIIEQLQRSGNLYISRYFDENNYVSSQAILKSFIEKKAYLHLTREYGKLLRQMNSDRGIGSIHDQIKTLLLRLYDASDARANVGGMRYSDATKNVSLTGSVGYSLIGESTPETVFAHLSDEASEDGFISRHCCVISEADRPHLNGFTGLDLNPEIIVYLNELIMQALKAETYGQVNNIEIGKAEYDILIQYDRECTNILNSGIEKESIRQIYNRSAIKVFKLAGSLASADNFTNPKCSMEGIVWAINFVNSQNQIFLEKIKGGSIASESDDERAQAMLGTIKAFLDGSKEWYRKYIPKHYDIFRDKYLIPYRYLSQNCGSISSFRKHKYGGNRAIRDTLSSLVASGYLIEISQLNSDLRGGYIGELYKVLTLN